MRKKALITGASSGIGMAVAKILANHHIDVVICGRRRDRLESLALELSSFAEVKILNFDVTNRQEVSKAFQSLPRDWQDIDILVNNAGNAFGRDSFQDADLHDWEMMMDLNVKGLLYVSKTIIPNMISRKSGHIINIGSIAGKEVYAKGNVYCASKYAVDAITQSMRIDMISTGIKVSSVNPGMVETEFSQVRFKGDQQKAAEVYQDVKPLQAEDIAEIILFAVTRPPHVNISDLTVLASAQANATLVHRGPPL